MEAEVPETPREKSSEGRDQARQPSTQNFGVLRCADEEHAEGDQPAEGGAWKAS